MGKYKDILESIGALEPICPVQEIALEESLGHVLRQDIISGSPMPAFNKSAVDGYACRKQDLAQELQVLEMIPAGKVPNHRIGENQCAKIMTGGVVPEGADCVFMVEDAKIIDAQRVKCLNPQTRLNICYLGEDYQPGDVLVKEGSILGAEHLAVIAGAGMARIRVSRMPSVGVLVTGSELVAYDRSPEAGKIRDTNSIQLISLLKQLHLSHTFYGIIRDEYTALNVQFQQAIQAHEIVIFTGGAAVGDFDLVPKIIEDNGFDLQWTRTGLKPGNPMSCAVKDQTYVFGLSGNPVSSFVQFKYLVVPVIYRLMGAAYRPLRIRARMRTKYVRKNADRQGIVPVRINQDGAIEEIPFNGSAHINALPLANALMEVPVGKTIIEEGEMIYVRPI